MNAATYLRPLMLDLPLQIVGAEREVRLVLHAERVAVVARAGDQRVARHARLGDVAGAEPVGRAERAHRRAVVGVPARDDLVGARLPGVRVVLLGDLDRGFHRLRAAGDEEDL